MATTTTPDLTTPNAQDILLAMQEVERLYHEPVAIFKCESREGNLPGGTAVGFQWRVRDGEPQYSWCTWRWYIEGGRAILYSGTYDFTDRNDAIDEARERARH